MITHTVLIELKDGNDAAEAAERILAMSGRIEGLLDIRAGVNFSASDFHVSLVSTHPDREALAFYATSDAHLELLEWLKPRIASRAFADFES